MSEEVSREPGDVPEGYTETFAIWWATDDDPRCERCRRPFVEEYFDVPCCGGEYTCTDTNKLYLCHSCRSYRFDW